MNVQNKELRDQLKGFLFTPTSQVTAFDKNDTQLAIFNVASLAINYVVDNYTLQNNFLGKLSKVVQFITGAISSVKAYNAIPNSAPNEKMLADPIMGLAGTYYPVVNKVHEVGKTAGIARNFFSKMANYIKSKEKTLKEIIQGGILHSFNLGCEAYKSYQVFTSSPQRSTILI